MLEVLQHYSTAHKQTDLKGDCYFCFYGVFFASRKSSCRFILSLLPLVFSRLAAVKELIVQHHSAEFIFLYFHDIRAYSESESELVYQ